MPSAALQTEKQDEFCLVACSSGGTGAWLRISPGLTSPAGPTIAPCWHRDIVLCFLFLSFEANLSQPRGSSEGAGRSSLLPGRRFQGPRALAAHPGGREQARGVPRGMAGKQGARGVC